jgi:outer membrane protein
MRKRAAKAVTVAAMVMVMVPAQAWALQPLSTFLAGASERNPDARVARATLRQRDAESKEQLSKLLPQFSARGVYTRNQYEAVVSLPGVGQLTIAPSNQLDAFLQLDVPIVDLSQFARYDASRLTNDLADANRDLTDRQLKEKVIKAYYQLAATSALIRSANTSLEASQKNLDYVKTRLSAGVAADLDLQRAQANLEGARQDVANAELSQVLAIRSLETLARVTPEAATSFPDDDLHEETPLATWLDRGRENLPELRVAEAQMAISDANFRATRYGFLPSLAAQGVERATNATGFTGHALFYTLTATLSWRFDLNVIAQKNAAEAAADVTAAQADGTRRSTEDAIVEAWSRIRANIAKARAARAQLRATHAAATIIEDRYRIGASTQLDVTQAQKDDFAADVARIQGDLDLVQARAILRLASGVPFSDSAPTPPAPLAPASPSSTSSNLPVRANP